MALKQSWFDGIRNGDTLFTKLAYASLHTGTVPTSANELDPTAQTGYARVAIAARSDWTFTDAVQDRITLNKNKDFPRAAASWGTVRSLGLSSAMAPGSAIDGAEVTFTSGLEVNTGGVVRIPTGSGFDVALGDNTLSRYWSAAVTATRFRSAFLIPPRQLIWATSSGTGGVTPYMALHTGDPTAGNELSGGGYARVLLPNVYKSAPSGVAPDKIRYSYTDTQSLSKFGDLSSPAFSKPTHWAIWDRSTGGGTANLLAKGPLKTPVPDVPTSGFYSIKGGLEWDWTVTRPAQA